ncbi:FmdB family zinc ribbon protein [Desulfotruncus alcoholivorax]|uniref:hypothetical protein n=1 Tax=Desulfotruncus alcoholivorax TaxID=265477 RepID=UPI000415DA54|nr:hypothetical protein [Desulfotruncus alcoholivorax]
MPQVNYKCNQCSKDFIVKYMFIKPKTITCPHCGSSKVKMETGPGSQCGCNSSNKKGFFT